MDLNEMYLKNATRLLESEFEEFEEDKDEEIEDVENEEEVEEANEEDEDELEEGALDCKIGNEKFRMGALNMADLDKIAGKTKQSISDIVKLAIAKYREDLGV